jgi:hypothetical protein
MSLIPTIERTIVEILDSEKFFSKILRFYVCLNRRMSVTCDGLKLFFVKYSVIVTDYICLQPY